MVCVYTCVFSHPFNDDSAEYETESSFEFVF